jgi:hypothetical protein
MADDTQDVNATARSGNDAPAANGAAAAPGTAGGEKQGFVPFFNEEYEFRSGLGEMGPAYRLAAIFLFMLVAAAMMYMASVWWLERHKPAPANNSEVVAASPVH